MLVIALLSDLTHKSLEPFNKIGSKGVKAQFASEDEDFWNKPFFNFLMSLVVISNY